MGAGRAENPVTRPLEGENIETEHWEDARHWMSIYDDLIRFKLGLLDRVQRELPKLHPVAQKAADVDVAFIEAQMAGYHARLDLWYQRVWQLHGLWLDPNGHVVRHKGREAVLTHREFELLQFLLDHPHRFYTASQITGPTADYPLYRPIMTELIADPARTSTLCCTSTAKKASTSSALVQP